MAWYDLLDKSLKALIETRKTRPERVFLVGVERQNHDRAALRDSLAELGELTTTAGNGAFTGANLAVTSAAGTFTADKINGYTVGVEIPVGAMTYGVNYSGVKYEGVSGKSATLGKVALAGRYGLSKNTFLYAGVSGSTGDLKDYISEERVVQAGLRMAW